MPKEIEGSVYNPSVTYVENNADGPYGLFADGKRIRYLGNPQYALLGYSLYSPLGIPAGPLANGESVRAALDHGFAAATYKTVRTQEHACHPYPNVLGLRHEGVLTTEVSDHGLTAIPIIDGRYPKNITNSFGVPSTNPDIWQPDMKAAADHARRGQLVIGSFQGTPKGDGNVEAFVEDYARAAQLVAETGVQVIEANLSCPNEGSASVVCYDLPTTIKIAEAIKNSVGDVPVILKIAYFPDQEQLDRLVAHVGNVIDGFTAINTMSARIIDEAGGQAFPGHGRERSGVSGELIRPFARDMITRLAAAREKYGMNYEIIATGGIIVAEDVDGHLALGADFCNAAAGVLHNPRLGYDVLQNRNIPYQITTD